MPRFWRHKSDQPLVTNYYGWYYSVEFYGITYTFTEIDQLRNYKDRVAAGGHDNFRNQIFKGTFSSLLSLHSYTTNRFSSFRFRLHENYIHFRYREQIINLFEQAYEYFSSERDDDSPLFENRSKNFL